MLRTFVFIFSASLTFQAVGQTSPPPPMTPIPAPSAAVTFGSNDQHYELTVRGVGKFMDTLKASEPGVYAELRPAYDDLVFYRNLAWGSAIGGVAVGALMVASGAADLENKAGLYTSGIFTIMLSPGFYYLFRPSHEDYLDFINRHNRLQRSTPLRIGFNTLPTGRGLSVGLALQF